MVVLVRSLVPKLKKSASLAIKSAVSAARGISIMHPTLYLKSFMPAFPSTSSATSTTIFFWFANSSTEPMSGISISGMTFTPFLATCTAASKMARTCISVISGYMMPRRQPRRPSIDENFPLAVVEELRRLGHVVTVHESGKANRATPDVEILEFATSEGRAVLTLNRKHFIALHASKPEHGGIVVCTVDPDFIGRAHRIHASLILHAELTGLLVRVNRPANTEISSS